MAVSFAVGLFIYGVEISNVILSIDDEVFLQSDNFLDSHKATGRWGLVLLWYILPDFTPHFISPIMAIVFLCLSSALVASKTLQGQKTAQIIFCSLFVASPFYIFMQAFVYQAPYINAAIFLTSCAAILFRGYCNGKKLYVIPALVFLTIAAASYQSLLSYFITVFAFILLTEYARQEISLTRIIKYLIYGGIFAGIATVFYYGIIEITIKSYINNYVNNFFRWGTVEYLNTVTRLCKSIYRFIIGSHGYPPLMVIAFISGIIAAIHIGMRVKNNKSKSILTAIVIILVFFICSICLNIMLGAFSPNRSQLAPPLFFAGAVAIYYVYSSKLEKLIIAVGTVFIILTFGSYSTKLLLADYHMMEADKMVAQRILDTIYDVAPAFYYEKVPVAFIGGLYYVNRSKLLQGNDTLGASFWNWDNGSPDRMKLFLNSLGLPMGAMLASGEQYEEAKKHAESMPPWPHRNSVQVYNGIVVVKLNLI